MSRNGPGPAGGSDRRRLVDGLLKAAADWSDPEHPARADAVERTLAAPNRFTEEALAFAVNQQMSLLSEQTVRAWVGDPAPETRRTVGVLNAGNVPFVGLQDALAVVLAGHRYLGVCSSKSPILLPAFLDAWCAEAGGIEVSFTSTAADLWPRVDAVIATGSDDTVADVAAACRAAGLNDDRMLLRGHRYGVAILTGRETEDEREGLAEDVLLHEGLGCRNVALIWAPAGLSPDPYLDAFARFRSVFPVHPGTPGALKMQQAFLEATGRPHAYGDGLEFLLSKGPPEPQAPGHVRWVEYEHTDEPLDWLGDHAHEVQVVVVAPGPAGEGTDGPEWVAFGMAQRPLLHWKPDGKDTIAFLRRLSADSSANF